MTQTAPAPTEPRQRWLSVQDTAKHFGVNPQTVRVWIKAGRLQAVQLSERVVRIPFEALEELAQPVQVATPSIAPAEDIESAQRTIARLLAKYEIHDITNVQMHSVMTVEDFNKYREAIATLTGIEVA